MEIRFPRAWPPAVALALALSFVSPPPGARAEDPSGDRTDVVPATDVPLPSGRNLVWCATVQLAWDAAADAVGEDGRLEVGPPAPQALVAALNRRTFPHGDLDEASTLVVGGLVRDGVLDRLREGWQARFPSEPPPTIEGGPLDAIGYAALFKDLPFATPFRVLPEGLHFAGGEAPVRAFGMIHDDAAGDVEAMAGQVVAYLAPEARTPGAETDDRPVVELVPRDDGDRILLSALDPGPTLETAWQALAERLERGRAVRLERAETLAIPRVRLDIAHRFEDFVGAPLPRIPGGFLREMRQSVRFSLTEKGAAVASDALVMPSLGIGMRLVFDRPFLLALMRRGATRPYLLVWVANADVLERSVPARSATPAEAAPFAGRWTIDRARTLEHLVETLTSEEGDDAEASRAFVRETYGEVLDRLELTLRIQKDGRIDLRSVLQGDPEEGVPEERHALSGRLVVEDERVRLRLDPEEGDEASEPVLVNATRVDGHLRLGLPGLPVVLQRS